jgi:hypothetical protein
MEPSRFRAFCSPTTTASNLLALLRSLSAAHHQDCNM